MTDETKVSTKNVDSGEDNSSTAVEPKTVQMTQAELDALVGGVKRSAVEKGKSQAAIDLEKIKRELAIEARAAAEQALEEREELARSKTKEEAEKKEAAKQQEVFEAIQKRLIPKFEQAKEKFSDWEDEVESVDWTQPQYGKLLPILGANEKIENPEEVLHHLCANGHLDRLSSRNPAFIAKKLQEISDSLEQAKDTVKTKPASYQPPKSLKPSHVSKKGDGDLTVADFRSRYRT